MRNDKIIPLYERLSRDDELQGVRLIAINDGVDSDKGDDDFTPFKNIMNEFYARDTSRKAHDRASPLWLSMG